MNAVFLDGSVRPISYRIDPTVWVNICGINDGQVVPGGPEKGGTRKGVGSLFKKTPDPFCVLVLAAYAARIAR
jgi:hypothetical protein